MGSGHFRSKVARRIFASFILAALIPAGVLSSLLYLQVREQLREQTVDHLHQEVKGYGIDILERLATTAQSLRSLAVLVNGKGANLAASDSPWLREQFAAVLWLRSGQPGLPLLNDIPGFPVLSESELAGRLGGKPGIWLRHRQNGRCEVFMLLPVSEERPEQGVLVAQLNPATLWNTDTVEPDAVWIFADGGELVFASDQAPVPQRRQLSALLGRQSGYVAWREGKQALAAASWPLFLESRFAAEGWTIVLIRPAPGRVLANDRFAFVYLPVAALLLLGVAYISSRLIRRQLNPIAQLTAATARLAEGDFDQRVQIATDDEFQRLAESFNHMASRIRDQWAATAAMAEIDRTILSSLSAERVIETVLERMPAVLQCDVLCFARFDSAARYFCDIRTSREGRITTASGVAEEISPAMLDELMAVNIVNSAADLPASIAAQGFTDSVKILVLPICLERQLAALMVVGYRHGPGCNDEAVSCALNFRDRIAVALSNVAWEEKLYRQAHYDALTGLANRLVLRDYLGRQLVHARREGTLVAVMFIDLDRFKNVNDSLGHSAGDELLAQVARSLIGQVRETDMVVRLGGDEFVIVVSDLPRDHDVTARLCGVAEQLLNALDQSFVVDGHIIGVSASIGIALYPDDAEDLENLLKNADAAMYRAKAEGRGNFQFYSPEFNANALETVKLEHELRRALESREFVLYYQPKVDAGGELIGAEALLRWDSPVFGRVPPNRFIPLAEETGLIVPLGEWVLETVCNQVQAWKEQGLRPPKIAVNLSAVQFRRSDVVDRIAQILRETGVDPGSIELEITESISMVGAEQAIARLTELKKLGVSLAMDDFGTGYSSLAYLRQFPLDVLKIDQSFVRSVHVDRNSQAIVRATLALAEGMGLLTVAEGWKPRQHFEFLMLHGCVMFQGYLFSPPVPLAQFRDMLERRSISPASDGQGPQP